MVDYLQCCSFTITIMAIAKAFTAFMVAAFATIAIELRVGGFIFTVAIIIITTTVASSLGSFKVLLAFSFTIT